jgi:molybdate transport system substrate-binding protein
MSGALVWLMALAVAVEIPSLSAPTVTLWLAQPWRPKSCGREGPSTRRHRTVCMSLVVSVACAGCPSSSSSPSPSSFSSASSPSPFSPSPSSPSSPSSASPPLYVAAASDLAGVMPRLVAAFVEQGGAPVIVTHGASGQLAAQLRAGAPFSVYLSANEGYVDEVIAGGVCRAESKAVYARGRLALVSRADLVPPVVTLDALRDRRIGTIALANPAHAPYGQAAKAALMTIGLWDDVTSRVVLGDTVRQAMHVVESGNADVGLVSHALLVSSSLPCELIDDSLYPPLWQALVVCGDTQRADASAFASFVLSAPGQSLLRAAGFSPSSAAPSTSPRELAP